MIRRLGASRSTVFTPAPVGVDRVQDLIGRTAAEASNKRISLRGMTIVVDAPLVIPMGTRNLTVDATGARLVWRSSSRQQVTFNSSTSMTCPAGWGRRYAFGELRYRFNGAWHLVSPSGQAAAGDPMAIAGWTPPAGMTFPHQAQVHHPYMDRILIVGAVAQTGFHDHRSIRPDGTTPLNVGGFAGHNIADVEGWTGPHVATIGPVAYGDTVSTVLTGTLPPGWYLLIDPSASFVRSTREVMWPERSLVYVESSGSAVRFRDPVWRNLSAGTRAYRVDDFVVSGLEWIGGTFDDGAGVPADASLFGLVDLGFVVDSRLSDVTLSGSTYQSFRLDSCAHVDVEDARMGPMDPNNFGANSWGASYGWTIAGCNDVTLRRVTCDELKLGINMNASTNMVFEDCLFTPHSGSQARNWGSCAEAGHGTGSRRITYRRCVMERWWMGHDAQYGGERNVRLEDCTVTRWIMGFGGEGDLVISGKHPNYPFTARYLSTATGDICGPYGRTWRATTTGTGTGALTLVSLGAPWTAWPDGSTNYLIVADNGDFEAGLGTVAAGVLTRTTVTRSSNGNSAVSFGAGTKQVFPHAQVPWGPSGLATLTLENAVFGCLTNGWWPAATYTEIDGATPALRQRAPQVTATNCTFDPIHITEAGMSWPSDKATVDLESTNRPSTSLVMQGCTVNGTGTLPPVRLPAPSLYGKPGTAATQGSWAAQFTGCTFGGTTSSTVAVTATGPGSVNVSNCTWKGSPVTLSHIGGSGTANSVA